MATTIAPAADLSPLAALRAEDDRLAVALTATQALVSAYDRDLITMARTMAACASVQDRREFLLAQDDIYADGDAATVDAAFAGRLAAVLGEVARMAERQQREILRLRAGGAQ